MGVEQVNGPPKKKLKQAQLSFCMNSEKPGNKRKLNSVAKDDGLALKVLRKDTGPQTAPAAKKETDEDVVAISDDEDEVGIIEANQSVNAGEDEGKVEEQKETDSQQNVSEVAAGDSDPVKEGIVKESVSEVEEKSEVQQKEEDVEEPKETGAESTPNELHKTVDESKVEESKVEEIKVEESKVKESNESPAKISSSAEDLTKQDAPESKGDANSSKMDVSTDSDLGEMDVSIAASSGNEMNEAADSSKEAGTPRLRKKRNGSKVKEERMKLKQEREEMRRLKKEEKEKKKQEDQKQKEEEKKKKELEKKRKEEAKEEEKKRKEEAKEEERKRKEEAKEEERKRKEDERKRKEEEKEEEKKKKEDERRKKEEEEKKKKDAEEAKKNMAKLAFTKFFIQNKTNKEEGEKKTESEVAAQNDATPKFMPFPVKADMRLAVTIRHSITDEEKEALTEALQVDQPVEKLYLKQLKSGAKEPRRCHATWPSSEEQHDVIIVEAEAGSQRDSVVLADSVGVKHKNMKAKLLQFHDNRRPPYWGTWRKKSFKVKPRLPFGQDHVLDYEVDSDSEWEDEGEGEDLDKEDESEKEQSDDENVGENGYLLDNTFVPHGYLSDEEAEEEEENWNPEDQKLKMKVLKQEFEQELKTKAERLKPRLLGCVWIANETTEVSNGCLYEALFNYRCKWDESEGAIDPYGPIVECSPSPSMAVPKFPSNLVEELAKMVHGSASSIIKLVHEFRTFVGKDDQLSSISKRAVQLKIKEIAQKTRNDSGLTVWEVNAELQTEFKLPPIPKPSRKSAPLAAIPPVADTPNKAKETGLVNFLIKGATSPSESRKRISTTIVSPAVQSRPSDKENGHLLANNKANSPADATPNKPKETPLLNFLKKGTSTPPEQRKRISTTLLSPVVQNCPDKENGLFPDQKRPSSTALPPNRKRIVPITLPRTAPTEAPSAAKKLSTFFNSPASTLPKNKPPTETINLCDDSNSK